MSVLSSTLRISLLDRVTGPAGRVNRTLGALQARVRAQQTAFAGFTRNMMAFGGGALGVYGLARGITSAVNAAGSFEASMNKLRVTSSATAGQMEDLRRQALEQGRTTQFMASQVGEAQNFLAMAGMETNEILSATPYTLQLAAAAGMDLGRSADVVTNIMSGYRMETEQLGHANDVLVKAFQSANTDLGQLAEAFKYSGPTLRAAGIDFEEATAALSLLGNAGIQGSSAGTTLSQAVMRMASPTAKARSAMNRLGLSFTDTEGRLRPLADIIEELEPHVDNLDLMNDLFGVRAGRNMPALIAQTSGRLRQLTGELRDSGGAAKRAADVMMEGWEGQKKALWSAAEGFQIAWGNRIIPTLTPMVQGITGLFGQATEFVESLDRRISVFDRLSVAMDGFASGFGFDDAGDALARFRDFVAEGIFGSEDRILEDAEKLGRLSVTTREIGQNFRGFADAIFDGRIGEAFGHLQSAFGQMPGLGQLATAWVAGKAFGLLAGGIALLVNSPWVRLFAVAWTVSTLIDAFRGAETIGEFIDHMNALSTFDWVVLAGGIALLTRSAWGLAAALGAVAALKGLKSIFAAGFAKTAPRAQPPSPAQLRPTTPTPGTNTGANPPARWTGPWQQQAQAPAQRPAGPTGPRGGRAVPKQSLRYGEFRPGARPTPWASSGMAGVRSFIGRGALAGAATWAGERAIEGGLGAFNRKLDEWLPETFNPERRAEAARRMGADDDGSIPSLFERLSRFLAGVERDDGTGRREGQAWDALRDIPSPQDHVNEFDKIRQMLEGGRPDQEGGQPEAREGPAQPKGMAPDDGTSRRGDPARDALRDMPSPRQRIDELEQIRRMLQGDGLPSRDDGPAVEFPDEMSIKGVPTVDAPPSGVQDVKVLNRPPPPNVTANFSMTFNGITNAEQVAAQVRSTLNKELRTEITGIYADSNYGVV